MESEKNENGVEKRILYSIKKSGFPEKQVSLPFRPIFDSCKKEKVKLGGILKNLENLGVYHEVQEEKILFFSKQKREEREKESSGFTEEYFREVLTNSIQNQPDKLKNLGKLFSQLSPEKQESILDTAKSIFHPKKK